MAAATKNVALGGTSGLPEKFGRKTFVLEADIRQDLAANVLANAESITLLNIPAKTLVQAVVVEITTPATATGDKLDIGDADSHNRFIADGDDAAGVLFGDASTGAGATPVLAGQNFYAAANDIRMTAHTGTLTGLVGKIRVFCVDMS